MKKPVSIRTKLSYNKTYFRKFNGNRKEKNKSKIE